METVETIAETTAAAVEKAVDLSGYDLTAKAPFGAGFVMMVTVVLMLAVLILFNIWIRRAYPEGHTGFLTGLLTNFMVTFILSLCTAGEYYVADLMKNSNPEAQQLWATTGHLGALMLECAIVVAVVYFAYRFLLYQPDNESFGSVLMAGLGYAVIPVFQWAMDTFTASLWVNMINSRGLEEMTKTLKAEDVELFFKNVEPLLEHGPFYYIMPLGVQLALVLQGICLFPVLHMVVKEHMSKKGLGILWLFYMVDVTMIMRQFDFHPGNLVVFLLMLVYGVVIVIVTGKLLMKYSPDDWRRLKAKVERGIWKTIFPKKQAEKKSNGKTTKPGSITKNAHRDV